GLPICLWQPPADLERIHGGGCQGGAGGGEGLLGCADRGGERRFDLARGRRRLVGASGGGEVGLHLGDQTGQPVPGGVQVGAGALDTIEQRDRLIQRLLGAANGECGAGPPAGRERRAGLLHGG